MNDTSASRSGIVKIGECLIFDKLAQTLCNRAAGGRPVQLDPVGAAVLTRLAETPGMIFSPQQLLMHAHDSDAATIRETVAQAVIDLRERFLLVDASRPYVIGIPRIGYVLVA